MIRVLVVDDSATMRMLIRGILESDPALKVVGEAADGEEAIKLCQRLQPDVITMDVRMPKMNGLEAIEYIMSESPRPIVVCTTTVAEEELNISFKAIEAGALMVLGKPRGMPADDPEITRFIATVKSMADVKVVRRRKWLLKDKVSSRSPIPLTKISPDVDLIAIGASTGGPPALHNILKNLGSKFPVPIVIVQHISPGFVVGLAHWLDDSTPFQVKVFESGDSPQPGWVYFAPDEHHLIIKSSLKASLEKTESIQGHCPSVNATFSSIALNIRSRAVGVLLTGMGEDGARGLLAMSQAGAYTLAQDKESSVVFGMPKVAIGLGAVSEILPLDAIAPRLRALAEVGI